MYICVEARDECPVGEPTGPVGNPSCCVGEPRCPLGSINMKCFETELSLTVDHVDIDQQVPENLLSLPPSAGMHTHLSPSFFNGSQSMASGIHADLASILLIEPFHQPAPQNYNSIKKKQTNNSLLIRRLWKKEADTLDLI